MYRKIFFCLFLFCFGSEFRNYAQSSMSQGKDYLRLMFYNAENFFDTTNDPTVNDDEFTPEGKFHWTQSRYLAKRNNIFRVIAHVGEWDPPAIVALCEIENRSVLNDLIKNTPLTKYPYRIVHKDSPDQRGIDVSILYRNDYLKLVNEQFIRVRFGDNRKRTRDILYAVFRTLSGDTLHVFVNHWPSRSGGQRPSEPSRILAASLVRGKVDSIFGRNPAAKIIVTGDLNDGPLDKSVNRTLDALTDTARAQSAALYNLTAYKTTEKTGTIKYQGKWSIFDQIIVSGGLLRGKPRTNVDLCRIFRADYLFEPDQRYSGIKPFRTYSGPKYLGGFSDHLPVYADILLTGR